MSRLTLDLPEETPIVKLIAAISYLGIKLKVNRDGTLSGTYTETPKGVNAEKRRYQKGNN